MMISPEMYFDMNIKNKTEKEIKKEISSLKRNITRLKNIISNRDDMMIAVMSPSYEMQLDFNIDMLKMAEEYLNSIS